ncbi:uncharacterized protein LOC124158029 isoform X1 [Ischnura elegans]|uniref:uncharacterized protein LOC124158029 isoform X1 n=1 Tax=Ischnura elegans TaxID=197161 RepID=UPI001ED880DC|nr:uncharacterized protein LOC124158029 isoform X1 [Ischnura elegans]XP_046389132.1 uncharacterized protein LOC124158029 isoform X1 [Ischnura elegans]XP_046389133.1 uncharacterized protein LOC124158029 isoform X1 [Ischnura elegans]XP_046389134.1 uncharacterized protein LOC124158029 isoform X1 [Ischnura elegans]XP_046389135.1 uncharacterized protein LOC124158029 isoform X1 [Ischnura elegans]
MDSVLLIGDDMGSIWTLKFLRPQESLFHRSRRKGEGAEHICWQDLERGMVIIKSSSEVRDGRMRTTKENLHCKYVQLSVAWRVHKGPVSQVSFCGSTPFAVASCCSMDRLPFSKSFGRGCPAQGGSSLILKTESSRAAPYFFKIPSGISCFDLWQNEMGLDCYLLATGSSDGIVRLWNPYDPKKVTSNLTGHKQPIKDISFVKRPDSMILLTICSGAEIRVWKTNNDGCHDHFCCLQVIHVNFSAISSPNKRAYFGSKVLYIIDWQPTSQLIVACSNEVVSYEFTALRHKSVDMEAKVQGGAEDSAEMASNGIDSIGGFSAEEQVPCSAGHPTEDSVGQLAEDASDLELHHINSAWKSSIFLRAANASRPATKIVGVNQLKLQQQKCQEGMREFVSHCTPHLALPIHPPLPLPTSVISQKTKPP